MVHDQRIDLDSSNQKRFVKEIHRHLITPFVQIAKYCFQISLQGSLVLLCDDLIQLNQTYNLIHANHVLHHYVMALHHIIIKKTTMHLGHVLGDHILNENILFIKKKFSPFQVTGSQ